ncbi:MAG: aminodeoxychorismate/anthranilate synthase component II [Bacteroidota bacterium]
MSSLRRSLKILLIDNYDSFTYNLYDYFCQLNTNCQVLRNDEYTLEAFKALSFDALVLSPGPKIPKSAGQMMALIDHFHQKAPILGICLGHQGIGEYFGAKLQKAALPMHGKTSTLFHQKDPIFRDLPQQFEVMRYHSLLLEDMGSAPLETIAQTAKGEVMALRHQQLPIYGLQFHPESILTEHGLAILDNWLNIVDALRPSQNV